MLQSESESESASESVSESEWESESESESVSVSESESESESVSVSVSVSESVSVSVSVSVSALESALASALRIPAVDLTAAVSVQESRVVQPEGVEQARLGMAAIRPPWVLQAKVHRSRQWRTARYPAQPCAPGT